MVQTKSSPSIPQPQHGPASQRSKHDRRSRLSKPNEKRRHTSQAEIPLVGFIAEVAGDMSRLLDRRIAFRLPILIAGVLLASGRCTASLWFQCAGVKDDWDLFYVLLTTIGRETSLLMLPIVIRIYRRFAPGPTGCWKLAIDDTPTKRYGRKVEGANIHHNPTPGPANHTWMYGHNWVCLAFLLTHPLWGVIALPVLSLLYVRREDVRKIANKHGAWRFRTKLELALELVRNVVGLLRSLGSQARMIVVMDGAYAKKVLLRGLLRLKVDVVSRLRCDAKLFDLPPQRSAGRGRPRKYGERISLAKRASRRQGWESLAFRCRGKEITRRYKTFSATTELTGGVIRVVLLQHAPGNWAAYFSTDSTLDAKTIMEIGSERWAIEEMFHDVKEVCGAGEQQVRDVWSNVGCWNLTTWMYSLVELACWDRPFEELVNRQARSWDNRDRRPSHADRRRRIRGEMLEAHYLATPRCGWNGGYFFACIRGLIALAA